MEDPELQDMGYKLGARGLSIVSKPNQTAVDSQRLDELTKAISNVVAWESCYDVELLLEDVRKLERAFRAFRVFTGCCPHCGKAPEQCGIRSCIYSVGHSGKCSWEQS